MDTQLKHYGALIEKIRKDRKMSRDDLCEGIMSKRNYQRFTSGEVSISSDKIVLITDRLMLNTFSLQEIYKIDNQDEYQKLKKAFNLVSQWNENEANKILATIDYDLITSIVNKQIYDITNLLIKKKNKKISDLEYFTKTENLIDYPKILKKNILNNVELSGLFALMIKETKDKENRILNYLINLNKNFLILIFFRMFISLKNFKDLVNPLYISYRIDIQFPCKSKSSLFLYTLS